MVSSSAAQGFLLLTLENCHISSPISNPRDVHGTLSLECVTLPVPTSLTRSSTGTGTSSYSSRNGGNGDVERDVWLVLRLNTTFEMPIVPTQDILHSRSAGTYRFPRPNGQVVLNLPKPQTPAEVEDQETLEVLLSQYAVLQEMDSDKVDRDRGVGIGAGAGVQSESDAKGRLVLVDEVDGSIVGTLEDQFHIQEDRSINEKGREKDPVIVEIPEDNKHDVHVRSVRPDEQDFLIRSAGYLSHGIVYAAGALASGMNYAATQFVARSQPDPTPMVFSENTKTNIRHIHGISGKAVAVTSKTTSMIHEYIDKAVNKVAGPGPNQPQVHRSASYAPGVMTPGTSTPPQFSSRDGKGSASGYFAPGQVPPPTPPPLPQRNPHLLNRVLVSTDLLLTALEQSAHTLVTGATGAMSMAAGHKYGPEAGDATRLMGESVRNVGVVYVDARGVGRRALIRRAGKKMIKAKVGGKDVVFGAGPEGQIVPMQPQASGSGAVTPTGGFGQGSVPMPMPMPMPMPTRPSPAPSSRLGSFFGGKR
ncbi:hypothetical protein BOTBODRAFT_42255 [Botryobasidium botryosum FD-172 SS1]|uniref:Senescence domain-containing protein n=1 Tax=Botryobasidium botryosum (strain FD-172 SS1) TaxID=930990 RepID=A0A067MV92_BOTB1|nr:hypothetical protein BOTBODRAFT_42255 [Botryobasidium botryosum FD-172 SS1]